MSPLPESVAARPGETLRPGEPAVAEGHAWLFERLASAGTVEAEAHGRRNRDAAGGDGPGVRVPHKENSKRAAKDPGKFENSNVHEIHAQTSC